MKKIDKLSYSVHKCIHGELSPISVKIMIDIGDGDVALSAYHLYKIAYDCRVNGVQVFGVKRKAAEFAKIGINRKWATKQIERGIGSVAKASFYMWQDRFISKKRALDLMNSYPSEDCPSWWVSKRRSTKTLNFT